VVQRSQKEERKGRANHVAIDPGRGGLRWWGRERGMRGCHQGAMGRQAKGNHPPIARLKMLICCQNGCQPERFKGGKLENNPGARRVKWGGGEQIGRALSNTSGVLSQDQEELRHESGIRGPSSKMATLRKGMT